MGKGGQGWNKISYRFIDLLPWLTAVSHTVREIYFGKHSLVVTVCLYVILISNYLVGLSFFISGHYTAQPFCTYALYTGYTSDIS